MPGVIVFIVIGLPLICGTLVLIAFMIAIRKGNSSKQGSSANSDDNETELIQEIHEGLVRMEKRIESLETIVLETTKANHNKPTDHE